ncbi:MAG: hypothetical protein OXU26_00350 [Acidobacteriota bacterium]|nr:hypothetical protein [Acidobacteriota bacterium]MDE2962339.1 hypothetical protein [Acidobacteriota bacterium]
MKRHWVICVVLAVSPVLCPAVEAEEVSGKLLRQALAKVAHIENLISAANEGDAESQFQLGMMISSEGRERAIKELDKLHRPHASVIKALFQEVEDAALEWWLRAAWQGHDLAQMRVAKTYERTDIVRAYAWYLVQVRKGAEVTSTRNGVTMTTTEWLLEKMTDDQVAKAEQVSREIEQKIKRSVQKH